MTKGTAVVTRYEDGHLELDYSPDDCTEVTVSRETMDMFVKSVNTVTRVKIACDSVMIPGDTGDQWENGQVSGWNSALASVSQALRGV